MSAVDQAVVLLASTASSYVVPLDALTRMIVVMGAAASIAGGALGAAISWASSRRTARAVRQVLADRMTATRSPRDVLAVPGPASAGIYRFPGAHRRA